VLEGSGTPTEVPTETPREPLGHLSRLGFALRSAPDVDHVARCLLDDLVELPEVARVGMALTEGGGRRLRFVATERVRPDGLEWCHIDSYDDVPLTAVVRTGEPVLGNLDELEPQFPGVVAEQRDRGIRAMAAWPLPGVGSPIGGIMLFYDTPQAWPGAHQRLLEATARRVADAVSRVRVTSGRGPGDTTPDDPDLIGNGARASVLLENDPRAPGAARRFLRDRLGEWDIDEDTVDSAQLCLSELVTNVVMHARTASELTLHLEDGVLTVVVRDLGGSSRSGDPASTAQPAEVDDPLRVYGRGLMLVDAIASRWGSEVDASGTTAWFILELGSEQDSSAETG
jgi:anti-sigma regulatory factor (Ser/Thr protein kinase)